MRFLVQAGANVYTHTLIRPSNGRGCHNHLFVGKFIPLLTGQEYESHLYSSTKKGPADLKNQIDMALSFIIEKYLAFVDYRTEGQVDSTTNRREE